MKKEYEKRSRRAVFYNCFENQEKARFYDCDNFFGIPNCGESQTYGDKLVRFCDYNSLSREERADCIAHFYYDDFKFFTAWREPDKYIPKLREFKAVITPDFSLYTDFPRAVQIMSCFRRQWLTAYWQSEGLDVIPSVVWGDRKSFDYCFLGIPENSVVSVSSVGVARDPYWNGTRDELFAAGYNEMIRRLRPEKVIFYGKMVDGLDDGVEIIHAQTFYNKRKKELKKDGKR